MTANRTPPMKCLVGAHDNPAKAPEFCQYARNDHPVSSSGVTPSPLAGEGWGGGLAASQCRGLGPPTHPPWEPGGVSPASSGGRDARAPRGEGGGGAWLAIAFRLVLDTVTRGL